MPVSSYISNAHEEEKEDHNAQLERNGGTSIAPSNDPQQPEQYSEDAEQFIDIKKPHLCNKEEYFSNFKRLIELIAEFELELERFIPKDLPPL